MIYIPVISIAIQSWKFASDAFIEDGQKYLRKQRWKSLFYVLVNPAFASKWYKTLSSSENLSIIQRFPKVYLKPFRSYLSIQWEKGQRAKVVLDTYRFINKIGLTEFFSFGIKTEIAQIETINGFVFTLFLEHDYRFRKEGELTFSLEYGSLGERIVSAAFSFEEIKEGSWACRIGCVQGHNKSDEYISKIAQKFLHGLRPKSLIIYSIQEFTRNLMITEIYGAGDSIQAYRGKHLIHLHRKHSIEFDYNKFWSESGGEPTNDGWYKLPFVPLRKNDCDIKSAKRAMYHRRYSMLDELSLKIEKFIANFKIF